MALSASSLLQRLGVCSWSLQPASPQQLAAQFREIGLSSVQLDLDPLREQPEVWGDVQKVLAGEGIRVVSGMFRCVGEDYSTLESIRVTGGLVPDDTWEQNWRNAQATAANAAKLGLKFVMFHAGFLPHDPKDPNFGKLIDRVRKVAQIFADQGITLGCETGQESAAALAEFLKHLNAPNVAINFDPANMLLYANGDPIEALRVVGRYVKGVHVKDAIKTRVPGTWGEEVVVGTGQVDWPAFFRTLLDVGFDGWMCLEREAGNQRVADIRSGKAFVQKLLGA